MIIYFWNDWTDSLPPWQDYLRQLYPLQNLGFLGKKNYFPDFPKSGAYKYGYLEWNFTCIMEQNLETVFNIPDLEIVILRAEFYADSIMRRCLWRGLKARFGKEKQLLANGKSADDFVIEAVEAFLSGQRAYRFDMDLETNLKRAIESRISTWKKQSDRLPVADHKGIVIGDITELDPVSNVIDPGPSGAVMVEQCEQRQLQRLFLEEFKSHLKNDKELSELLSALEEGFTKPAEIQELTGIPATRITELKRKLASKAARFMIDHPSAEALEKYGTN